MPPYALANNLYLGTVPNELKGLTVVEEAMIVRRHAKCCVLHLDKFVENSVTAKGPRFDHGTHQPITQRGI